MATTAEKQALGFLVLIALMGAGVQAVGVSRFDREARAAAGPNAGDAGLAALERQLVAVDSARAAGGKSRSSRPKRGSKRAPAQRADASPREPREPRAREPKAPPEPIDVNVATAADLERLPRVGPALAERVVAYRNKHGAFAGPDDLRHVRGIGPSTVRLLLPLVTFSGRHSPLLSESPPLSAPFLDDVV